MGGFAWDVANQSELRGGVRPGAPVTTAASGSTHTTVEPASVLDANGGSNVISVTLFSHEAELAFGSPELQSELDPRNVGLTTDSPSPIVCAIDVTKSMGDWAKVIWDKLPMFFGQIVLQGYLADPALSFCAVGDANCDTAPLQVTGFERGSGIDSEIAKIWLEEGGGGQNRETYELAAWYYARNCAMPNVDGKGFFFFTGDEGFYPAVLRDDLVEFIGMEPEEARSVDSVKIFAELKRRFHVFLLHKPYFDKKVDQEITAEWEAVLGADRVLPLDDPKAVVDVMLGAIALVSGTRTLDNYFEDMKNRGQTDQRLSDVQAALLALSESTETAASTVATATSTADVEDALQAARDGYITFMESMGAGADDLETEEVRALRAQLAELKAAGDHDFPEDYRCPITMEPFVDPVMTMDGYTYERDAIVAWLEDFDVSPVTNENLPSKKLIPNRTMKKAVSTWIADHGSPHD